MDNGSPGRLAPGESRIAPVAMTLAAIAYAPPDDIAAQLRYPGYATGGHWSLVWHAATPGYCMYVAKLDGQSQWVVGIRGSSDDPFTEDFWIDWFRDLDVLTLAVSPVDAGPGARVALGTAEGLTALLGMRDLDTRSTLVAYLRDNVALGPWNVLVVGHSLGGCLASVLAPYLYEQLCKPRGLAADCVVPVTFAAPTAGNDVFAGYLEALYDGFPTRYVNSLDIAPNAFSIVGLAWILKSFPAGPSIDYLVWTAIELEWSNFEKAGYAQPGTGTVTTGSSGGYWFWFLEAGYQHTTSTYLAMYHAAPVVFPKPPRSLLARELAAVDDPLVASFAHPLPAPRPAGTVARPEDDA